MIFLDTGFLFGLMSTKDEHHGRVVQVFGTFKGKRLADEILTTNHVVAEALTLTRKLGHEKAVVLGERLYGRSWRASTGRRRTKSATPLSTSSGTAIRSTASLTA